MRTRDFGYFYIKIKQNRLEIKMKIICSNTGKKYERNYKSERKSDIIIGKIVESVRNGRWNIIGRSYIKIGHSYGYICDNLNTGTVKICSKSQIKKGYIRDEFYPHIYGVGYTGGIKNPSSHFLYVRWEGMLNRCYNKSHIYYRLYGGDNVTVNKRWHNFTNFVNDSYKIDGYNKDKIINNELQLDKDKKQLKSHNKIYSKDTCTWLTSCENHNQIDISHDIRSNQELFKFYNENDNKIYYHYNQSKINELFNFSRTCVSRCLSENWRKHKGYHFEYVDNFPNGWTLNNCNERCIELK